MFLEFVWSHVYDHLVTISCHAIATAFHLSSFSLLRTILKCSLKAINNNSIVIYDRFCLNLFSAAFVFDTLATILIVINKDNNLARFRPKSNGRNQENIMKKVMVFRKNPKCPNENRARIKCNNDKEMSAPCHFVHYLISITF